MLSNISFCHVCLEQRLSVSLLLFTWWDRHAFNWSDKKSFFSCTSVSLLCCIMIYIVHWFFMGKTKSQDKKVFHTSLYIRSLLCYLVYCSALEAMTCAHYYHMHRYHVHLYQLQLSASRKAASFCLWQPGFFGFHSLTGSKFTRLHRDQYSCLANDSSV